IEPQSQSRTVHATINANDWIPNSDRTVWTLELDVPDIDGLIMDHGTVLVDIAFDQNSDGEYIYEPLTTVYDGIVYRYDYTLGSLLLDVSAADSNELIEIPDSPPGARLKIFLFDSESIN